MECMADILKDSEPDVSDVVITVSPKLATDFFAYLDYTRPSSQAGYRQKMRFSLQPQDKSGGYSAMAMMSGLTSSQDSEPDGVSATTALFPKWQRACRVSANILLN